MLLGGVGRVGALLVAGDRLVLDAVVGGEVGVAQRERRGRQPEHGDHQLVAGAAPAHAPRRAADSTRRADHRGEHLRVLERKLHLGHLPLDHRQQRERLAQARDAAQARQLGDAAPRTRGLRPDSTWIRPSRERRATAQ